jgi:hypothetical protein
VNATTRSRLRPFVPAADIRQRSKTRPAKSNLSTWQVPSCLNPTFKINQKNTLIHSDTTDPFDGQLQSLNDGASDFFHLPLLALQQGLERWIKISLCFHIFDQTGEFPDSKFFVRSKQGHNLQSILDQLVDSVYTATFESCFPYVKQDRVFLKSKVFRGYIHALSEFGVSSRYFHLNTVLGFEAEYSAPELAWQELEGKILDFNEELKNEFFEAEGSQEVVVKLLAESRAILVRCGRALARLSVLGALGEDAKSNTGYVSKFLQLSDEDLLTVKFDPFHTDI